jgi:two-component system, chemotaxis family, sensor kinase CheA
MSDMDEIIREFLVESSEGLDQMDRDLVELEKDPDCQEKIASVFRAIHTIKGTSGVLGFLRLEALAHAGENLLSRLRDRKLRLTPAITSALLGAVDAVRSMLLAIEKTGSDGDNGYPEVIAGLSSFDKESEPPRRDATPPIGELLLKSGVTEAALAEALEQQQQGDPRRVGQILIDKGDAKPETVLDALNRQAEAASAALAGNIRVDVGLLDKVMNLVGELVLARNHSMALVRLRAQLRKLMLPSVPGPVIVNRSLEEAWKRF